MRTIRPTQRHIDRLAKYTVRGDDKDACWAWTAATDEHGYGRVRVDYTEYAAHRLSFAIHYGCDPGELDVLHRCDNPSCTNPRHLVLGTHTDNMRDAAAKGRLTSAGVPRNVGEKNGQARLSDAQIAEIRELRRAGVKQRQIAERYGVSRSHISMITNNLARFAPGHLADAAKALE